MTDEERQRTMDFILEQQAQFSVNDLQADIETYEAAVNAQEAGRRLHITATAAIEEAIQRGMKIVRRLDAIVRNVFRDDPAKLAAWEHARHFERTPRRKAATPPPPQPHP